MNTANTLALEALKKLTELSEEMGLYAIAQPAPSLEMARRVASEYGEKDSQIDSGNLYAALRQCLDYIAQPIQPAEQMVAWLKEAMDKTNLPSGYRAPMIGYFCNASRAAQPPAPQEKTK